MAKKKSNKFTGVFSIFFSSIKTYFLYLDQCFKYLAFPVLGQVIGIILICTCAYYFRTNIDNIKNISGFFEKDSNLIIVYIAVLLPFLLIFIKALYDYIIAFCSLNLLFYTVSNKKKIKNVDFKSNNRIIERRLFQYVILMLIVTILIIIPPFIFISPLIWLFLCLSFQVFSFEGNISAAGSISRSFELVKSNIIPTIILLLLCYIVTYRFLPDMFIWLSEKISLSYFLINRCESFIQLLPLDNINNYLSIVNIKLDSLTLARAITEGGISFIIIGFTLPFRCCCFTELYKLYDNEKIKEISKESDEIITRAAGRRRKN